MKKINFINVFISKFQKNHSTIPKCSTKKLLSIKVIISLLNKKEEGKRKKVNKMNNLVTARSTTKILKFKGEMTIINSRLNYKNNKI